MTNKIITISINDEIYIAFLNKIKQQNKGFIEKGDISSTIQKLMEHYIRFVK